MRAISILIADAQPLARRGLRALLEANPDWKVVPEAVNGREAVTKAIALHPVVAILDMSLPRLNGVDACRLITKSLPLTQILVLSMYSEPQLIARAFRAGARGYVLKSDADRDLISAVDALLQNRTFFTESASEAILDTIRRSKPNEPDFPLSIRETEVLQLLVEGKSNKEVAVILGISTRTVENHRAQIMRKLGCSSLSDLVRYAIRNKIVEI